MSHQRVSSELLNSSLKLNFLTYTIATYDVTFMDMTCACYHVILVGRSLQCVCYVGHLKEKLKIQEHRPFSYGFGFTKTCIIYEDVLKCNMN